MVVVGVVVVVVGVVVVDGVVVGAGVGGESNGPLLSVRCDPHQPQ